MQPMDLDPEGSTNPKSPKSASPSRSNSIASSPARSPSSSAPSNSSKPKNTALYEQELASITSALASVSPAAARAAVRQNWRKCLLGSPNDESFFLRRLLKRTSDHVVTQFLADGEQRILEVANEHGQGFLDRAMEVRLESITAKDLVAMLAHARRLGYDEMDLVDADEMVLPAEAKEASDTEEEVEERLQVEKPQRVEVRSAIPEDEWEKERLRQFRMQQQHEARAGAEASVQQQIQEHVRSGSKRKICPTCGATFLQSAGLKYHMDRQVCLRQKPAAPSKYWCEHCKKGFTTSGGLTYHRMNNVCKGHEMARATSPNKQLLAEQAAIHAPSPRADARQPLNPPLYPLPSQLHNTLPGSASAPRSPQKPAPQHYPAFNNVSDTPPALPSPIEYRPPGPKPAITLTAEQLAEMQQKLAKEEERFEGLLKDLPENMPATERSVEIKRLKAGSSTRKSIIRREYGVQVRRSKVATANAIRTADGGIDVVMKDVDAPPSTSGFAPINRITAFRAVPGRSSLGTASPVSTGSPAPDAPLQRAPPIHAPDAKRRRTTNLPAETMEQQYQSIYHQHDEANRRSSVDPYRRPSLVGAHRLSYPMLNPDQRPTPSQRQNGIIPPSRPPMYTNTNGHPHAMPQPPPPPQHPLPEWHQYQHPPKPPRGFTSVNVDLEVSAHAAAIRDRNARPPAAPVAPMQGQGQTPTPFYVNQPQASSHAHPSASYEQPAVAGGFGVLKAKKVPVGNAQRMWERQRRKANENWPPIKGAAPRGGEIVEILSDSSSGANTPTSDEAAAAAAKTKATPSRSSTASASAVPPEALQAAGGGGVPAALPASTPLVASATAAARRSPRKTAAAAAAEAEAERAACGESDSDSDGGSDTSIPARRPVVKVHARGPR